MCASSLRPQFVVEMYSLIGAGVRDWISNWRKRGWKTADGKDVKNKSVIMYLSKLLDQRGQRGQTVRLQHVAGHAGIEGNEGADVLAGLGTLKPVLPERDWSLVKEEVPKDIGKGAIADFQARYLFLLRGTLAFADTVTRSSRRAIY
jgi:hypothetical protein